MSCTDRNAVYCLLLLYCLINLFYISRTTIVIYKQSYQYKNKWNWLPCGYTCGTLRLHAVPCVTSPNFAHLHNSNLNRCCGYNIGALYILYNKIMIVLEELITYTIT